MILEPIGVIRTPFRTKDCTPIQGALTPEYTGFVEVFPPYAEGLSDIDEFSHLILLYELDRALAFEPRRLPLLADEPKGLFATRHPARPNRLGLTVVTLLSRQADVLEVGMVDMLDETPLLDIKPYVARFDAFPEAVEGWFAGCAARPKPAGRE